jgi:2'-hydroxyisoflavone reductase
MHILVIGGTRFLGRAVVDDALAAGHDVTLFNRGRTDPGLYPHLETIVGDREADLSALRGRAFDAVIDTAGYDPAVVERSARALVDTVGRYVFVSTVSVYADHDIPQVEGAPVLELSESTPPGDRYGARKAACESIVEAVYGDRALCPRPGLIVGPHDPTDRFAYWPRRMRRGGTVLAPSGPDYPVQFIDVRDLGGWIVHGTTTGRHGIVNVTGPTQSLGGLLDACRAVAGVPAELIWVSDERLLAAGVDPWMGVPMWIGEPGWEAANYVDTTRAHDAGLTIRPLVETVADTLAWDTARGGPAPDAEGLTAEAEQRLLALLTG